MKKRQWGTLLLVGLLVLPLSACAKKDNGGASSSQSGNMSIPEEPSVSVIVPVTDPEPLYINPLTGEAAEEETAGHRPFAIMLNNLSKALPQVGVSKADVIYEIVAEGGITRMMALFQEFEDVGDLACVRSARDYYVSLALGHDAVFIHAGGSPQAYSFIKERGINNIDLVNGPYPNTGWRDPERRKNAGLEHSLFTSSENVLRDMKENIPREHEADYEVGWSFDKEPPSGGQAANKLSVRFSNYKTGEFTYDAAQCRYAILQHFSQKDIPYVDGADGTAVTASSVLVLYTDVKQVKGDDKGRMEVRTTGTGDGLLLRDGQLYEITWQRGSETDCYSFLDKSGAPISLAVGPVYINVVSTGAQVEWE